MLLQFIPLFVLVFAASFIKNHNNIMRCGAYIRFHIEEEIEKGDPSFTGWEMWADRKGPFSRKYIDYISVACTLILFLSYYAFSVLLVYHSSFEYLEKTLFNPAYKPMIKTVILHVYILLGILYLAFLSTYTRLSTDRRKEESDESIEVRTRCVNKNRRRTDGIAINENVARMIGAMC